MTPAAGGRPAPLLSGHAPEHQPHDDDYKEGDNRHGKHNEHCPACGRFIALGADGFYASADDESSPTLQFCRESCADRYFDSLTATPRQQQQQEELGHGTT